MSEDISTLVDIEEIKQEIPQADPVQFADPVQSLLKEYNRFLSWAKKFTGNTQKAEDLVQDAYVKLIKNADCLYSTDLKAWMFRIMHNEYNSQGRHEIIVQKHNKRLLGMAIAEEESKSNNAADFSAHEISSKVTKALDTLPDYSQELLKDFAQGMKYKDLASKYNVPIGTVMSRLGRARKMMHYSLANYSRD